jgi:hypothetical protein
MSLQPEGVTTEAAPVEEIESELLWSPEHSDYVHWIRRLVVTIIESNWVKDEILCQLKPLCELKVCSSDTQALSLNTLFTPLSRHLFVRWCSHSSFTTSS